MRIHPSGHPAADRDYQKLRQRIDGAGERLRRALERPGPAEVRRAYLDLDQAVGRALEFAESRVRLPYRSQHPPPRTRLDPSAAAAWHAELERLRNAREDLRFTALDDPRYGVSAVVVGTRAATGPEVAGLLRTGEHFRTALPGDGMGIDLESVVDAAADRRGLDPPAVRNRPAGPGSGVADRSTTLAPSTAALERQPAGPGSGVADRSTTLAPSTAA